MLFRCILLMYRHFDDEGWWQQCDTRQFSRLITDSRKGEYGFTVVKARDETGNWRILAEAEGEILTFDQTFEPQHRL